MSLEQRKNQVKVRFSVIQLLIITLLLFPCLAIADITFATSTSEENPSAVSDVSTAPCRDLKPFNNIDELLYQFYINLDSDCLFKMPVEELEKVWGIKILSDDKAKLGKERFHLRSGSYFEKKPFETDKDAFFIEIFFNKNKKLNEFHLIITDEYSAKFRTLIPDGTYPQKLPEPLGKYSESTGICRNYVYYWLNSNQTRMIYLAGCNGVTRICVIPTLLPGFINNNDGK